MRYIFEGIHFYRYTILQAVLKHFTAEEFGPSRTSDSPAGWTGWRRIRFLVFVTHIF